MNTKIEKQENTTPADEHAPRKMTFAENAMLTVKVLTGFGLLGAALWAVNAWTTAQ